MKTILIATDFSQASDNASLYGKFLAKAFNARIILFSAYQPIPVAAVEVGAMVATDDMQRFTYEQLKDKTKIINKNNEVSVQVLCKMGASADSILETANDNKADIIILGMKERGKGLRRVFGSTVTELIRKSTIPLIVVPEEVKYTAIKSIALAHESDIDPKADEYLLYALRSIAKRFQSKLYMVHVARDEFKEAFEVLNRPFRLVRMTRSLYPEYEYLHGKNVPEILNTFVAGHKVNLLTLLPHKHSLLERLFFRSTTRSMVFDSHIPLLILPANEHAE